MSIRLDPRRVNALKHLAGEAGVRPGDLVRQWVEERIDAERGSGEVTTGGESLRARLDALAERVAALESGAPTALHDEMIAVIRERGPMSAADLATAITERGRYTVPRSGKPLDAKTVSQRVSNPTYRSRFTRSEGRIGLADPG
jgi:hypothetical protein